MKKAGLIVLALALGFQFCGQRERTDQLADEAAAPRRVGKGATQAQQPPLIIRAVTYNLETLSTATDLTATPVMADPEEADVEFEFRWLVNNLEIPAAGATLEKSTFKKNDWVYCLVKAVKGGRESVVFRADYIRIPNTGPVLLPVVVQKFMVPGVFRHQIQATDLDKDELAYRLISPLDLNIQVDAGSGLITWEVDRVLAERLTAPVDIAFEVSDSDGVKASTAIRLTFTQTKKSLTQ